MKKLGVIYGGVSTENEVSQMSARSVINNLDKQKYDIYEIYIDKDATWYKVEGDKKERLNNIVETLKSFDVVFPVLHGKGGEDGTIQGMFEMFNIPYVGCGVLSSSVGMDKVYTKIIFDKVGLNQTPYVYIKVNGEKFITVTETFEEKELDIKEIMEKLKFPMFIKPSSSGSSVGVRRATNEEELRLGIQYATKYDNKVLVEQGVIGKEVECAVLGNDEVIASTVGEIQSAETFYSYDAKYNMPASRTVIPAEIPEDIIEEIRKLALKAFKSIDGKGLSRVDFFVEEGTNKIYINEINTMPGFTKISMYPKLFDAVGIEYAELLDKLIEYGVNR